MSNVIQVSNALPPLSEEHLAVVRRFQDASLELPQMDIETSHLLHGGMYVRSIMIPAKTILTGALIKIPTVLIVSGETLIYVGSDVLRVSGYKVFAACAGRKQVFVTITDTFVTMIFPTSSNNVADAEWEFTDEADSLLSRKSHQIEGEL